MMQKTSLRERKKASRRANILDIARRRFQSSGYTNVTIEDIAAEAELSAVTIYNYFNSKAGLLLALVGESDLILIDKIDACVKAEHPSLVEATLAYGRIMREHAIAYLQKPLWREVISASISEGSKDFGQTYTALDNVLIKKMEDMLVRLQDRNLLGKDLDAAALADCLFSLQNIRFFQFIADDSITISDSDKTFSHDLSALQRAFGTPLSIAG